MLNLLHRVTEVPSDNVNFVLQDNNDCLCGRGQFRQSQIYSSERQNFTRTVPLVLTKSKSLT